MKCHRAGLKRDCVEHECHLWERDERDKEGLRWTCADTNNNYWLFQQSAQLNQINAEISKAVREMNTVKVELPAEMTAPLPTLTPPRGNGT